jgi:divalent metal cation (Fe/Co/Zn/Cd) transporter
MAGDKTFSNWIGYIFSFAVLFYVVLYIHELFSSLAELFTNLANLTKAMSKIKRTALVIMLVFYFLGWIHFPIIAFFVSVLVLIPAGFTFDEYKRLLADRLSTQEEV